MRISALVPLPTHYLQFRRDQFISVPVHRIDTLLFKSARMDLQTGDLVLYENNGTPNLAVVQKVDPKKITLLNQKGSELTLPAERLYLLGEKIPHALEERSARAAHLTALASAAEKEAPRFPTAEVWESLVGDRNEVNTRELCEIYFGDITLHHHLVTRLALLNDSIFFKRSAQAFIVRSRETVEELKIAAKAAQEREALRARTVAIIQEIVSGKRKTPDDALQRETPENLALLEDLALGTTTGPRTEAARQLLEFCLHEAHLEIRGSPEDRAFRLLEGIHHFHPDLNLALLRHRPPVTFNSEIVQQASVLAHVVESDTTQRVDLTNLTTITIDDASTQDMDDALSLERVGTGFRLGIHISDIASLIAKDSPLDKEAERRGTSIYNPEMVINMLPHVLAEDIGSLRAGVPRLTISYLFNLDREFAITGYEIVPARIQVKKRFSYEEVDVILRGEGSAGSSEYDHLINELYSIAMILETRRIENGAIKVSRPDAAILVHEKPISIELREIDESGPARSLIGEMMVLANTKTAEYTAQNRIPILYRGQSEPEQDIFANPHQIPPGPALDYLARSRLKPSSITIVPKPHASLGLRYYTQITSPIRRYADLCTQRQILAALRGQELPYKEQDFKSIIENIERILGRAKAVTRESRRFWLLKYIEQTLKQSNNRDNFRLHGTVLRTDLKHPLVEIKEIYSTAIVPLDKRYRVGSEVVLRVSQLDPLRDLFQLVSV